jgi:hypothetical protein
MGERRKRGSRIRRGGAARAASRSKSGQEGRRKICFWVSCMMGLILQQASTRRFFCRCPVHTVNIIIPQKLTSWMY